MAPEVRDVRESNARAWLPVAGLTTHWVGCGVNFLCTPH